MRFTLKLWIFARKGAVRDQVRLLVRAWKLPVSLGVLFILAGTCMVLPQAPPGAEAVSQLLTRLAEGSHLERLQAAGKLISMRAKEADVISAFAAIVRNPNADEVLRGFAANGLKTIGSEAVSAADALIDMMLDEGLDENWARTAAEAWAEFKLPPSPRMVEALATSQKRRIVNVVAWALGASKNPETANLLIDALGSIQDRDDERVQQVMLSLKSLDRSAAATMIHRLSGASSIQKQVIIDALSWMFSSEQPSEDIVDAILLQLRFTEDLDVRWRAAQALGGMQDATPKVIDRLIEIVTSNDATLLRWVAADALVKLRLPDPRVPSTLVNVILSIDEEDAAKHIASALGEYKPPAVDLLVARLRATSRSSSRARLIRALGEIGSPSAVALPEVLGDIDGDGDTVSIVADALPKMGARALVATPLLAQRLQRETDHDLKLRLAGALSDLAPYALDDLPPDVERIRGPLTEGFSSALATLQSMAPAQEDRASFVANYVRPVEQAANKLTGYRLMVYALWSAAGLAAILSSVGIFAGSWRVQRWIRVQLGQRWVLAVGRCDYLVEITQNADRRRLNLRPLDQEARPRVLSLDLFPDQWPPEATVLQTVQSNLRSRALIRIEADKAIFGCPWTSVIGDPWSQQSARIAGQICLSSQVSPPEPARLNRVTFAGLRCAKDSLNPYLQAVVSEIEAVADVFERWGADVTVLNRDARVADMCAALEHCDIVHAAVHAMPTGLFLQDGLLKGDQFGRGPLRCRLLVLSACEAGDIQLSDAFIWAALSAGINVLAATRPVNDQVCRIFFSELYLTLLPRRQFGGVPLAAAIAAAAAACRERYARVALRLDQNLAVNWEDTVDSFVLFGDPSLCLQLQRR